MDIIITLAVLFFIISQLNKTMVNQKRSGDAQQERDKQSGKIPPPGTLHFPREVLQPKHSAYPEAAIPTVPSPSGHTAPQQSAHNYSGLGGFSEGDERQFGYPDSGSSEISRAQVSLKQPENENNAQTGKDQMPKSATAHNPLKVNLNRENIVNAFVTATVLQRKYGRRRGI